MKNYGVQGSIPILGKHKNVKSPNASFFWHSVIFIPYPWFAISLGEHDSKKFASNILENESSHAKHKWVDRMA
jgi:hypothetical protein